jgi:hypothetical protein
MSSARIAFYFLGTVLLAIAAVSLGRQFAGEDVVLEWQGPCVLALVGLGALGVGLFSNVESTQAPRVRIVVAFIDQPRGRR